VRKKSVSQSGNGNAHAFFASTLCAVGVGLAIVSLAATPNERGTNPRADVTSANWFRLGSYVPPPNREMSAMVFDPDTETTILFGGATLGWGRQGDTWSFDGQPRRLIHRISATMSTPMASSATPTSVPPKRKWARPCRHKFTGQDAPGGGAEHRRSRPSFLLAC
jgi:hypothetical protein